MNDELKPPVRIPGPPEPITVVITLDQATGSMQLQGPIGNRTLMYGILVSAMETVLKHGMEQQKGGGSKIMVPGFPGFRLPRM